LQGLARRQDVELWWECAGQPGSGPAAVLHPGAGDTADVFPAAFCERLRRSFAAVVRFDPRDAGRSTRTDGAAYDQVAMADDLWAVADAAGVRSATLIGYSGGGVIVQQAAVRHPERTEALVLVATAARPPAAEFSDRALTALMTPTPGAGADDPTTFEPGDDLFFLNGDDDAYRELQARMIPGRAPTARATERHFTAILAGPVPTDDQLATLAMPVLVLHSTDDRVLPHTQADATAKPYAKAVVHRVSGIGHIPLRDQWVTLADRIADWRRASGGA
jgi:pimeloyl-ACP methyl ester carboxylesterase